MDPDIIFCIFEHLTFLDIIRCTLVNKQFSRVSKNELLWKRMSEKDYPDEIDGEYEKNYGGYYRLCWFLDCQKDIPVEDKCNSLGMHPRMTSENYWNLCDMNLKLIPPETSENYWNLCDMNLKLIPPEIGLMTNLVMLYLHRNQLKSIPIEISRLTKLTRLDIDNNNYDSIPSELSALTNLQVLYIDPSQRKMVPPSLEYATHVTRKY
jgi:hypothetical protein